MEFKILRNIGIFLIRVKPIIERTMDDALPWVFQPEHAAVHTARLVSSWLEEENINVLAWPSVSPDLNILENFWGWFFRQLYGNGQQYHNVIPNAIQAAWNTITQGYLNSLFNSIPNIIFEVIHTINVNFFL
jgi:hypothetical protein